MPSAETNDVMAAEVLSRLSDLIQAADSAQPEDMAAPDDLTLTNGLPQTVSPTQAGSYFGRSDLSDNTNRLQASGRSQTDDRRSRGRRSSRSKPDQTRSSGSAGDRNPGERVPRDECRPGQAGLLRVQSHCGPKHL